MRSLADLNLATAPGPNDLASQPAERPLCELCDRRDPAAGADRCDDCIALSALSSDDLVAALSDMEHRAETAERRLALAREESR